MSTPDNLRFGAIGDSARVGNPYADAVRPDPALPPWERVQRAMLGETASWWLEVEADLGKLPAAELAAWKLRAQIVAGLVELERLWAESGAEGPLPRLRDLSAPVTREQIHAVVRACHPEVDTHTSRWFRTDVLGAGVDCVVESRERVRVNLRQLMEAFKNLSDSDVEGLRYGRD